MYKVTNQEDYIFQIACEFSVASVANHIYAKLLNWNRKQASPELLINAQLCQDLSWKLEKTLGQSFFEELLGNVYSQIKKRQPCKKKIKTVLFASPSNNDTNYYEDELLATHYGDEIAYEVIQRLKTLEEYQKDSQFLVNFLRVQDSPTEAQLFEEKKIVPCPSSFPVYSILNALIKKDDWKSDMDKNAYYCKKSKTSPTNFIEHYIAKPDDVELLPLDEAQQIIDKFGFDTAKLHLIFAAHCMNGINPWEERFYLKASDIVKDLGWDKRTDRPKSKLLKDIASAAFILSCLLVKTTWIEGKNSKGQIQASCPVGRMWDLTIETQGQLNIQGTIDEPYEVVITVRPGGWTERFLNKAGTDARKALYQFGWLSQEVLRIDPYRNELALRLGLLLTLEHRYHKSGRYKVRTLLEKVLPTSDLNRIIGGDRRYHYDLKKQWNNALGLLTNLNWKVDYDLETYPNYLQPENIERNPKGYLDTLLEALISIHPPEETTTQPTKQKQPAILNQAGTALLTQTDAIELSPPNFASLQHCREVKGWSQRELAKRLGISRSFVAHIETGRRHITPEIEEKLKKFMSFDS